jgi:hypothetical protein
MLVGSTSETRWHGKMARSKRRSKARARGWEGSRQILFVGAIGGMLAGGLFAGGKLEGWQFLPWGFAADAAPAPSEAEIYTGSILYLPDRGTTCRQFLFDNRTGRIKDNGLVDCVQAYYRGTGAGQWSTARAAVISQSFRGR